MKTSEKLDPIIFHGVMISTCILLHLYISLLLGPFSIDGEGAGCKLSLHGYTFFIDGVWSLETNMVDETG